MPYETIRPVPFGRLMPLAFAIGLVGLAQYLGITTWLMTEYPGGNLHDKSAVGYDFFRNFLSDLGRTRVFRMGSNPTAHTYALTLGLAGCSTIVFFGALGHFLFYVSRNWWAVPATLFALVAGIGYIGVALYPINEDYGMHITFVQVGFIGFWLMGVFVALAIFRSPVFPNMYARAMWVFLIILGVQICIMLFGPRSWRSEPGLLLQVTAQKIVVYSEIAAMLFVNVGALKAYRRYRRAISSRL